MKTLFSSTIQKIVIISLFIFLESYVEFEVILKILFSIGLYRIHLKILFFYEFEL